MAAKKQDSKFSKKHKKHPIKNAYPRNDRIRPDDQNFFDALMSVDMKNDPDGKKVIEIIKAL